MMRNPRPHYELAREHYLQGVARTVAFRARLEEGRFAGWNSRQAETVLRLLEQSLQLMHDDYQRLSSQMAEWRWKHPDET